ncbi:hypothetical protein SISNIDRAFT_451143 [Sistotremastrum niveocremeum HHB9708]|uniref:Uncharacterized protein n=1 Tax=Sistotremastrum niveocremeum HHB9708 TaxID=1314777 RepID=A0A164XYQ7_9AGAM|nr:hypothetical protein SISNIDRAFT_451143 [Sistotremastrum niveocremeum HHB9708]
MCRGRFKGSKVKAHIALIHFTFLLILYRYHPNCFDTALVTTFGTEGRVPIYFPTQGLSAGGLNDEHDVVLSEVNLYAW